MPPPFYYCRDPEEVGDPGPSTMKYRLRQQMEQAAMQEQEQEGSRVGDIEGDAIEETTTTTQSDGESMSGSEISETSESESGLNSTAGIAAGLASTWSSDDQGMKGDDDPDMQMDWSPANGDSSSDNDGDVSEGDWSKDGDERRSDGDQEDVEMEGMAGESSGEEGGDEASDEEMN